MIDGKTWQLAKAAAGTRAARKRDCRKLKTNAHTRVREKYDELVKAARDA